MLPIDQAKRNGRYLYHLDGRLIDIEETFCVRRTDGGLLEVTGHRQAASGPHLKVQGQVRELCLERAAFEWCSTNGNSRSEYRIEDGFWNLNDEKTRFSANSLLFGLLRVFTGPLLLAILERSGKSKVVTPILEEGEELLQARESERTVGEDDAPSLPGVRRLIYRGGPYPDGCECRISADGILEQYAWNERGQGRWEISLEAANSPHRAP